MSAGIDTTRHIRLMSWLPDLRAGGVESTLVLELQELRSRRFDVSVGITQSDKTLLPLYDAAGIQVFDLGDGGRLSRFRRLVSILRTERPDVVEVILYWPNIMVRPVARLFGIRVVTQLANEEYGPTQRANSKYGPLAVVLSQMIDLVLSPFSNSFRSVSHGVARMMHRRLLLPTSKLNVIYIARDIERLGRRSPERRQRVRESMGLTDEQFVIMSTGRRDAQKNLSTAIRAAALFGSAHPGSVLLIAGRSGNDDSEVEKAIRESAGHIDVQLLGERSDVADLLAASDCYLMASRWEGFSGALVEAMALELPLVLSDIPSMHEVTDERAWFFPVDDAEWCSYKLSDVWGREYPEAHVEFCRRRAAEDLNPQTIGDQLENLYRNAVAPGAFRDRPST